MTYSWKYCDKNKIKNRLLIDVSDSTYDSDIEDSIEEASRFMDLRIEPYETLPPVNPITLSDCCADLSSAIFKRRHMPQELDQGWWLQGTAKLEAYIKNMHKRGKFNIVPNSACCVIASDCCE